MRNRVSCDGPVTLCRPCVGYFSLAPHKSLRVLLLALIALVLQESNNLKRGDPEDLRLAAIKGIATLEKEQVCDDLSGYPLYLTVPLAD